MSEKNIKTKEGSFAFYAFAIFSSMLLWLFPIGLIAGLINGFVALNIAVSISGIMHFLIAVYMLRKNTPMNNLIQIALTIICSLSVIYFAKLNLIDNITPNLCYIVSGIEFFTIIAIIVAIVFAIFKKQNKSV
jgi:hypothetical protein